LLRVLCTALGLSALALATTAQAQVDLRQYIYQYECPDGSPPKFCLDSELKPIEFNSTVHTRYRDWGIGTSGYMTTDIFRWFVVDDKHEFSAKIWSWDEALPTDYSTVDTNANNGGEVYEYYKNVDGKMEVRILGTKDSGTPGVDQFFNPCEAKNHGWVIADETVPTGRWSERVYGQRATTGRTGCPDPINHGFTRTRLEWLNIPYQWPNGWIFYYNEPVIISKQYDNTSEASAKKVEGFACIQFRGCRIWFKCVKGPGEDLDYRDPKIKFIDCPDIGWQKADMRATLKMFPGQNFQPAKYKWPWS